MSNRKDHLKDQQEYKKNNPVCEMCRCRPTQELDHIVQKSGGTYEMIENYFASCVQCHRRKHSHNLRLVQISIKKKKGEWSFTPEQEIEIFGKHFF